MIQQNKKHTHKSYWIGSDRNDNKNQVLKQTHTVKCATFYGFLFFIKEKKGGFKQTIFENT